MNSFGRNFSIPCLLSKKEIDKLTKQRLEDCHLRHSNLIQNAVTEEDDTKHMTSVLSNCPSLPPNANSRILSLNSDEIVKDSRFREQISHTPPYTPLIDRNNAEIIKSTILTKHIPTHTEFTNTYTDQFIEDPKNSITPVRIKRTRKCDGSFDYCIYKNLKSRCLRGNGTADCPIIIDINFDDRPEEVGGYNESGTAVSLEWMDDGMSLSSLSYTKTVMVIDNEPDEIIRNNRCTNTNGATMMNVESTRNNKVSFNSSVLVKEPSPTQNRLLTERNGLIEHIPPLVTTNHSKQRCIPYGNDDKQLIIELETLLEPAPSKDYSVNKHLLKEEAVPINSNNTSLPSYDKPESERRHDVILPCQRSNSLSMGNNSLAKIGTEEGPSFERYVIILREWQERLNKKKRKCDSLVYVENNIDRTVPPLEFNYISQSVYSEGVPVPDPTALFGCHCTQCTEKSNCCAFMAGQKFAYYKNGKLRVGFRTPIYECNSMCQCDDSCPNRVVQKGSKFPLCIFRTPDGRGWGVKTYSAIEKGKFVIEYVGELITVDEAERRGRQYDKEGTTYLFDLDYNDTAEFTIDAAKNGNVSHFLNHSCDPNLRVFSVWIDTLDLRLPRLALFARRDIAQGEELTFDYQMNYNMESVDVNKRTPCLCGTKQCRSFLF